MDQTQRLDWGDEEEETPVESHKPVANLHMFAGIHGPTQDFPIYSGPNVIGRHPSCDITLPAQSVSKKHAILDVTGDCHTICDNGSLNKTRRSKVALMPNVRYALTDGDFLLFADVACRYTIVKKNDLENITAEESENDSMFVPATQSELTIEKTPSALGRMGCGAVLVMDSADEDEEVQRKWNDAGEGVSKDALRTSGDAFCPSDTVVPESDEEDDTSTSGTHIPSLNLRCDKSNLETRTKESSCISSLLNVSTPPAVKEPAKSDSSGLINVKDQKLVGKPRDQEIKMKNEKDTASEGELLKEEKDGSRDNLPCGHGKVVQSGSQDSGLKDRALGADNQCSKNEIPEVSSTSSFHKDKENEMSRRDVAAPSTTESNPDTPPKEEIELKPREEEFKLEADLCIDSDTDSDEDFFTTSSTIEKKKDDLETQSDKEPKQSNDEAPETPDADVPLDEDKKQGRLVEMNIDSDTDVEDDKEVSANAETIKNSGNSSKVPKVKTIPGTDESTGFNIDGDTRVEDGDISRSEEKKIDQESKKSMEEKREQFHLDSETDVEDDDDVSSIKLKKGDLDSVTAAVPSKETKDGIHLESDTDAEEKVTVFSTDVSKEEQALNFEVQGGFHVDSDTDVEDVKVSCTVVTKQKQDSSISVKYAREGLDLDSDTDVDEEDQRPGISSAVMQSRESKLSHIDNQLVGRDKVGTTNKEATNLHFDSDTDVDEDDEKSTGPGAERPERTVPEKSETKSVNEAADFHLESDTDEDDTSLGFDKHPAAKGGLRCVDKVLGLTVDETGEATEVSGADTSTVSPESSAEKTPKADTQGADFELMATQCFLEPETDLPDEEEATQAYILSSTWAEPDIFKRPSDPVGVLQISTITLNKSKEEEDDENAVAETQLFCLQTNDSPGPSIKVTPQHEEEDVDNQQEMQPPSIVNGSGREDQETPQGATSQADTEPVSQNMSTKPSDESGTWLHLKRDVPASNWIKCLQTEGETSNIKDDTTQDELEATQSYIMDSLNIKRHPKQDHASLSLQDDNTRLCELAAPSTNDQPRDPINFEALTVPATQNTSPVPSIPGADSSVTATESLVTVLPSSESLGFVGRHSVECTGDTLVSGTNKSVVPATESPLKELNNMETQVTDDGTTQALSLDLPVFNANAHGNNLEESFTADAAQSCSVDVEGTADHEAQTSGGILSTVQKGKDKLTDTEKEKPSFNRGLSRRKKEQPGRSTEILTCKLQVPEVASAHLTLDETVELGVCDSEQSKLGNAVSEMIEESKPEKVTLRRGRRRKSTENPDSKARDELVVPTTYQRRTSRMALDVEPSTSNEVRKRQPSRKSAVNMKEEKQDETEDLDSTSTKCKDEDISKAFPENQDTPKSENVSRPTTIERSAGQIDSDQERDLSIALKPSGSENEIVLASAKNTENESRILELPEQSESTSAPPPKKPVRGKRQAAPKAIQDDTQESELISTPLEKQGDLKGPTSRTPKSHEGDDTNASQNKEADQTGPEAQHFRNTRPIRRLSNVKGEVKEGSQIGEQPGKLLSKRATRGNQKKEKNSQQALEDNPDTSTLSKRTRKRSREESPKPGQVTEVEKTGEDDTVQQTRKTRRSYREEQKTDANEESLKSSSTAEAQTKITRRGSRRVAVIDQKEIVKETVTRKRRYSKPDAQLENQPKTSARGRKVLKQEDAEETTTEIIKEAKAAQNISRRTRSGNRANEKIGTEHEPDKEVSQSQISSKNRKKASDDSHTLMESTEPKDKVNEATEKRENEIPSSYDEMPRKGTPPAKETAQVFTPVASRKRGKVPKAEVELQRKNSDDGQGAEEEVPSRRRGRARKVTDDSNTSTSGGEISNCEPLCRTRTHRGNTSTLSARPYVPRLGAKTKVLFTGVVIEMGEDTIRLLGGEIAESVFDCTHLITDRVRRTLKFLCALARGIPIVSLDWLDKCKKNGCFLSYTKFLVKDEEQEKKFNFVLSESLQKAKRKPLFEGYEFHVTPNVKPDPDFMKDIICCSGATYLPDFPQTFKEKRIIVSTPEEAVQLKKSVPAGIPVTSPEILLSGILQQRINVAAYLLSSP